ncbi:MAG: fibronectin type III domain-containing protein [Candidatus Sungbacteria bacterium]|nr:fibronectin type III domain-containing protein [Candidatus Sungbacteria bacterium]
MKYLFFSIIAVALLLSPAIPAFAQTTASASLLQTLQQQLATLQAQFQALVQARAQVSATSGQVAQTVQLLRNLREGMSGDDVKALQAILAKYPDLYPEGLITGFYGKATARAVVRFQQRENLPGVGFVGPLTLARLVRELAQDPLGKEDDTDKNNGEHRPCAIVPPGHLIAPGWLRKNDGIRPIVPACQKLPEGIERQTGATMIFGVAANAITNTSAHITWKTNTRATSAVWYGTTSPVVRGSNTLKVNSSVMEKEHNLALTGLSPNTTYYYLVESTDEDGHTSVSAQYSFATFATVDTAAPIIFNLSVNGVTNTSVHVTWSTNERSTSKVWYSATNPVVVGGNATLAVSSGMLVTNHDLALTGLATGTVYYYVVESTDESGNKVVSAQSSFVTLATIDTTAPVISSIAVSGITTNTARITWNTDESANSKVWYGVNSPVSSTNSTLMANESFSVSHDLTLTGLAASTTYYYVVESSDASGNKSVSAQGSFVTSASASDTMPPVLSGVTVSAITGTSAHVLWTTDEMADSTVWYSTTAPIVVTATTSAVTSANLSITHDVTLSGLAHGTTYYYMAGSKDASGNLATSAQYSFTTLGQ